MIQVQVRVGNAWVPAHPGYLTKTEADALRKRYKEQRPKAQTRAIDKTEQGVK